MWPKWDITQIALLKIDQGPNRLHHHFTDKEELKSAKRILSSPPIIQTPGSGKPKQTFFPDSKVNVNNESKQILDPAKVAYDVTTTQSDINEVLDHSHILASLSPKQQLSHEMPRGPGRSSFEEKAVVLSKNL